MKTQLNFTVLSQNRESVFNISAFSVNELSPQYNNHYSGFLGIAPYTGFEAMEDSNLMYQLKNNKNLTFNVISFYFRKSESIIKFGSYDKVGLEDPSEFYIFQADDDYSWVIALD